MPTAPTNRTLAEIQAARADLRDHRTENERVLDRTNELMLSALTEAMRGTPARFRETKECPTCHSVMELERSPHSDVRPIWVCQGDQCTEVH